MLQGQQMAFYVVLPTEKNGIESLLTVESKLSDASVLNALIDKMVQIQLTIQLPKFSFRQKLNLKVRQFLLPGPPSAVLQYQSHA